MQKEQYGNNGGDSLFEEYLTDMCSAMCTSIFLIEKYGHSKLSLKHKQSNVNEEIIATINQQISLIMTCFDKFNIARNS